jgi:hypothetical protein
LAAVVVEVSDIVFTGSATLLFFTTTGAALGNLVSRRAVSMARGRTASILAATSATWPDALSTGRSTTAVEEFSTATGSVFESEPLVKNTARAPAKAAPPTKANKIFEFILLLT